MIWWTPWITSTLVWPVFYWLSGSGTLASGAALLFMGTGLIIIALKTGAP